MGTRQYGRKTSHSEPGPGGGTGSWRVARPVMDPAVYCRQGGVRRPCFICWLYCPDWGHQQDRAAEDRLRVLQGCGICAERVPTRPSPWSTGRVPPDRRVRSDHAYHRIRQCRGRHRRGFLEEPRSSRLPDHPQTRSPSGSSWSNRGRDGRRGLQGGSEHRAWPSASPRRPPVPRPSPPPAPTGCSTCTNRSTGRQERDCPWSVCVVNRTVWAHPGPSGTTTRTPSPSGTPDGCSST